MPIHSANVPDRQSSVGTPDIFPKHLIPYIEAEIRAGEIDPRKIIQNAVDACNKTINLILYSNRKDLDGVLLKDAVIESMARTVYDRIKAANPNPAPQYIPQWLECEKELGHKPTNVEYICWCSQRNAAKNKESPHRFISKPTRRQSGKR